MIMLSANVIGCNDAEIKGVKVSGAAIYCSTFDFLQ